MSQPRERPGGLQYPVLFGRLGHFLWLAPLFWEDYCWLPGF